MDLEDAVKHYGRSISMQRAEWVVQNRSRSVSDANLEKAHEELKKAGYIN